MTTKLVPGSPAASGAELPPFDLNLLVPLDALLRERHVTRAAEHVGVSQPAMSATLKRLRTLLGDPLLVRTGNTTHLTPYARSLVEPVADVLDRAGRAFRSRPSFDPTNDHRSFVISASETTTVVLISRLRAHLADAAPNVRIHIRPLQLDFAAALADPGGADLLVLPDGLVDDAGFCSESLYEERWVSAVWSGNDAVPPGDTMSEAVFLALPHLVYSLGGSYDDFADQHLDQLGIERHVEATFENFLVGPFLLRGTRLTTFVHERLGRLLTESADLRLLEPPFSVPSFRYALYWHPRDDDDPAVRWMRDQVTELARTM